MGWKMLKWQPDFERASARDLCSIIWIGCMDLITWSEKSLAHKSCTSVKAKEYNAEEPGKKKKKKKVFQTKVESERKEDQNCGILCPVIKGK